MRSRAVSPGGLLRLGTPEDLGLADADLEPLRALLSAGVGFAYAGAAALLAREGVVIGYMAVGTDVNGRPLSLDSLWPLGRLGPELTVRPLYWLLVGSGRLDPDAPAGEYRSGLPVAQARRPLGQWNRGRFGPGSFWPEVLGRLDGRGWETALAERWETPLGLRLGWGSRPSRAPTLAGRGPVRAALLDLGLYLEWLRREGQGRFGPWPEEALADLKSPFAKNGGVTYDRRTVAFRSPTGSGDLAILLRAGVRSTWPEFPLSFFTLALGLRSEPKEGDFWPEMTDG